MTEVRRLEVGGLPLEILEAGRGSPRRLLLVHGFTGAKEDFADHIDTLAEGGRHVVAPDLRGHGASAHPEEEAAYNLAIFAEEVVGLADVLGWPRFALVGHSMGGMVAQLVALDHPDRLCGLVLLATGHGSPEGIEPTLVEMGKAVVRQGGTALLVEILAAMNDGSPGGNGPLGSDAHRQLLETRPGYAEAGRRNILNASGAMWVALVDELMEHPDRLERLGGLAVPTLVVVGEQDTAFLASSRRMAAAIAGARLVVVPGAGHSPQFEAAAVFRRAVEEFLDEVATVESTTTR